MTSKSLEAKNYADLLIELKRFKEAKSLMCKTMPGARRVLGENNELTLRMRWNYGEALYQAEGATLDDLREAVTTLEEVERTARRVLGGAHPNTAGIEGDLRHARAALRAANLLDGLVYPVDPSWQRHWRVQESTSDR